MVTILHAKDLPNLFRYGNAAAGYDFSEEGNILFIHLNGQDGSSCTSLGWDDITL